MHTTTPALAARRRQALRTPARRPGAPTVYGALVDYLPSRIPDYDATVGFTVATVDAKGRVPATALRRDLGWTADTLLRIDGDGDRIVIWPHEQAADVDRGRAQGRPQRPDPADAADLPVRPLLPRRGVRLVVRTDPGHQTAEFIRQDLLDAVWTGTRPAATTRGLT